jgi:hypothetical protein
MSGLTPGSVCQASSSACPSTLLGPIQLCADATECVTAGDVCKGVSFGGMTIQYCQAPTADGGSSSGGDSGTGAETGATTDGGVEQ